jgi:hypothetical protein
VIDLRRSDRERGGHHGVSTLPVRTGSLSVCHIVSYLSVRVCVDFHRYHDEIVDIMFVMRCQEYCNLEMKA